MFILIQSVSYFREMQKGIGDSKTVVYFVTNTVVIYCSCKTVVDSRWF